MDDIKFMTGFNVERCCLGKLAIAEAISKFTAKSRVGEDSTR